MHRRHKNMDDQKSAQTERRQNRSSSLSLFLLPWNLPPFPSLTRLHLALTTSPFSDSARNLGLILDSKLSTKKHVCQTAYFELKRISSIRRFLTEDAAKTLVISYILSRLDYCNCLQKIQNFAARLVLLISTSPPPFNTSLGKTALAS